MKFGAPWQPTAGPFPTAPTDMLQRTPTLDLKSSGTVVHQPPDAALLPGGGSVQLLGSASHGTDSWAPSMAGSGGGDGGMAVSVKERRALAATRLKLKRQVRSTSRRWFRACQFALVLNTCLIRAGL